MPKSVATSEVFTEIVSEQHASNLALHSKSIDKNSAAETNSTDTEMTKATSTKKVKAKSTDPKAGPESAAKSCQSSGARASSANPGTTAAILKEITSTQQALVEGMTSGFSQIAKLLSAKTAEESRNRKRHVENGEDADSECDSPSRQNAKRPRKDAVSDSEPESSDIECLINETNAKDSAGNEADILCDIAQDYDLDDQCGSPVGDKLAAMLNKMARSKLSEEKLKEKLNKYSRPQNCENLVGAKVNPEIWSKIRPETRSRDLKMQKIQNTILKAITPLAELSDSLLNLKSKNDVFDTAKAVRQILDSVALLTHANCDIIQRRRELIRPDLNKLYQQICAEHVSFTGFLFGDDLPQKIKDINMTNRVGQKLSGQEHKGSFNRNYFQNARAKQRWPKNDHRPYHRMHFAHKVHQVKGQYPKKKEDDMSHK